MRIWTKLWRQETGQALVVVALLMVGMLGMLGLVLDGGRMLNERRLAQNAADAAALAGAFRLRDGGVSQARADAFAYAAQHGYDNDGVTNTVEVHIPPISGNYAGNGQYVQVVIRRTVPLSIIQIIYSGASDVSSRATAGVEPLFGPYAIIALDQGSGNWGLRSQGSNVLRTINGGIMVNSTHESISIQTVGANTIIDANPIHVRGGVGGFPSTYSSEPRLVQYPVPDPLAHLPLPSTNGVPNYPNYSSSPGGPYTIHAGKYNGGIRINSNSTVIVCPGVYILANGGLDVRGGATLRVGRSTADGCTGSELANPGVMFFNTGRDYPGGGSTQPYGQVSIAGTATLDLEAPRSGPYQGILFFQDRNNNREFIFNGNGSLTNAVGAIYVPGALVSIGGNSGLTTLRSQVIAHRVYSFGNSAMQIERTAESGQAIRTPVLVE